MYILCLGEKENIGFEKHFVEIVAVLANLLVISLVLIAYLVYQIRLKSGPKAIQQAADEDNNSGNVHVDDPSRIDASTYEQVGDEQHYTDLHRSGVDEYDDRSYAHLNQVADVYVIQEETGV